MKKDRLHCSSIFWDTAHEFLYHYLPDIRRMSPHTFGAYRDGLNQYIDFLEKEKGVNRKKISYADFSHENMNTYLGWLLNIRKLSAKTCNLRMTAIRSLLEYVSFEYKNDFMALYLDACNIKNVKTIEHTIEYFENRQMKALLTASNIKSRTGRRNQMMLILYYDTAARISEVLELKLENLHLDSDIPYIMIYGKGRKYRTIPLMDKTIQHLKRYISEFHPQPDKVTPLFYAITYGERHRLSTDTVEKMIKKYSLVCQKNGIEMPVSCHCHMIRKTRAMNLYQSGVPLTHIQQLLGHKEISTTAGFYAFATLDTLAKSLEKAETGTANMHTKKWTDKDVLAKIYRL